MNFSKHAILTAAFLTSSLLSAQQLKVEEVTLANGMKVLVEEDHTIPNVALYVFYRIGSRNERVGTTGVSHFFEHMMFNGAKKYGPGMFDKTMEAAGGSNNAYTTKDDTVYQDWFPSSSLPLIFELEADRIRDLAFDPKIIQSERGVVASERRTSVDANNFGILSEQLWAAAFTAHPYHWPVVGWMSDIENWKMEDLRLHFEVGYSPSNATMVVVGDVTESQVLALAKQWIEPIPSHEAPAPITTVEPEQEGERRIEVRKFAQLPIVMMAYHIPAPRDPDRFALEVLETILFSGESSRLYQRLVDKGQLALSVGGGSSLGFDPTLFRITVRPRAGIPPAEVEKAVYEELRNLETTPVSDHDLARAKNILLANFYRDMKTINGRANAIGSYELFLGDYHKLFEEPQELDKVTAADVERVVKKYFQQKNRTVATLIPEVSKGGQK